MLTFEALSETSEFARKWVHPCFIGLLLLWLLLVYLFLLITFFIFSLHRLI
ncbi:hypothetical protein ACS0TY_003669 [Phlomoides rotata]